MFHFDQGGLPYSRVIYDDGFDQGGEIWVEAAEDPNVGPPFELPSEWVRLGPKAIGALLEAGEVHPGRTADFEFDEGVRIGRKDLVVFEEDWKHFEDAHSLTTSPAHRGSTQAPGEPDTPTRTAGRSWVQRGGDWHISFDGKSAVVPDLKGMRHIATMLSSDQPVHVRELVAHETVQPGEDAPPDRPGGDLAEVLREEIDRPGVVVRAAEALEAPRETRRIVRRSGPGQSVKNQLLARREALKEEVRSAGSDEAREVATAELRQVYSALWEEDGDPGTARLYRLVLKRFKTAWTAVEKKIPGLGRYLESRIEVRYECVFKRSPEEETWRVVIE